MSTLPAATAAPVPAASVPTPSGRPRIVMLGDSLTAGYGLESDQSYPALLQDRLDAAGYAYDVVNAGVSGDTSAGGLRRLDWSLDGDVHLLVVALGGNDGLRGLPVTQLEDNLSAIIEQGREAGATVVLAGMEAPPNYGPEYTGSFRQVYRDLAREYDVTLIPFLLDGVAGVPSLNLPDGIHPNPEGARKVEALVWTAIEPHLERVEP
ncbi:MAG: arylesterase [Acidimicrobiia bacterium]|nr:arylesterase [Acidimicrobiia bacterium]